MTVTLTAQIVWARNIARQQARTAERFPPGSNARRLAEDRRRLAEAVAATLARQALMPRSPVPTGEIQP